MRKLYLASILLFCLWQFNVVQTEAARVYTTSEAPRVELFPLPQNASFLEGSNFEVPIFINTEGNSVNAVDITLKYDPKKIKIVNPSGGKSIVGMWLEAPYFDNTKGTAHFLGGIPGGIKTSSGLIVTITFKAMSPGSTFLKIQENSSVLLNDGEASKATLVTKQGSYSILTKPAEGLAIYSDTHPSQDEWYNNKNVSLSWDKREDVSNFSFALDNEPKTVPDANVTSTSTNINYTNLKDGVWYFHISMFRKGVWGAPSHRTIHIDSDAPANFIPTVVRIIENDKQKTQISFATTDGLSGIDHYEVSVMDFSQAQTQTPVYLEAESPYTLPENISSTARVYIRATDIAGNVRDVYVDVEPFKTYTYFYEKYTSQILAGVILLLLLVIGGHFVLSHHYVRRMKKAMEILENDVPESDEIKNNEAAKEEPKVVSPNRY